MRIKLTILSLPVILIMLLSSCGQRVTQRTGESTTTGWRYNDPNMGGFEVAEYVEQDPGPGLVLIEGGRFTMGNVEQDIMYDWNAMRRTVTVSSYYMDEFEVRNIDYREYLHWLSKVFVEYPEIIKNALPDTLVWRRRLSYNEPFVLYYFRHPAYHDYPVVGVSWLQATDYCEWRTDRVNEKILIDKGVLEYDANQVAPDNIFSTDAYLAGQYQGMVKKNLKSLDPNKQDRPVRMEDGILLPRYRLPTEAEWEYAALALTGNSEGSPERIYEQRIFPWNGHYLRNPDKQDRGLFMANFQRGRGDYMGVAGYLNDNAAPTAPVDSYWPNDYGLYCMAGNVNEWVEDVYRPLNPLDVDDFNPFRGNVFMVPDREEDGTWVKRDDTTGRMLYRKVTEEESMNRFNYQKADNINYKDGDPRSRLDGWDDADEGSLKMYNSKGDGKKNLRTLITDKVRVYKGGGWRDRAYWLSPGTRRFLDQSRSSDDIGFRCAMIKVGSPAAFK